MILCPRCRGANDAGAGECWNCGTELSARPEPVPDLAERLTRAFRCPKGCEGPAVARKIATAGTGLSRILDIQQHRFAAISCSRCGATELYSLDVLGGHDDAAAIIDAIFG